MTDLRASSPQTVDESFSITNESLSLVDRPLRVLKHGNAFAVFDSYGDAGLIPGTPEGLFFRDTRHLSRFELTVNGKRPQLLSSVLQDDNAALVVDLTNVETDLRTDFALPRDVLSLERTKFMWKEACFERLRLHNFDVRSRTFRLCIQFDVDFRDLFEVRGTVRRHAGRHTAKVMGAETVEFVYEGLDGVERRTRVRFSPQPTELSLNEAIFDITLNVGKRAALFVVIDFAREPTLDDPSFLTAYRENRRDMRAKTAGIATVQSSNSLFNEVCVRATTDLYTLMTRTSHGLYPFAGIPWYSTVFGRDGLITAMLLMWLDPSIARGVLRFLAAEQATQTDAMSEAQPGKILHEMRHGEMAQLGEVPFRRYYGSIDSTPLFVMLAGLYFERTGDRETIAALWPNLKAALAWCDTYGDRDGDGFVEYLRETPKGLANQGWKDSYDSIFHADGSDALGPIALCEVQAYVFAAKRHGSQLARALGDVRRAVALSAEAEALRARFEDAFWCDELETYALALDGEKRPCRVIASNAGHALFAGIASPARAQRVAATLMNHDSFSGWGIRTLAARQARYNPMSYHNGSIWPHDNALIAMGFSKYGLKNSASTVFTALFEAATHQEQRRLPELYCGFLRKPRQGPTAYPVACSPQAWAAAAIFSFLSSCVGMEMNCEHNEIRFDTPELPKFLGDLVLRDLRLGDSRVSVQLRRHESDVTLALLERSGPAMVTMSK
jgi:glycogen debranching enzyme